MTIPQATEDEPIPRSARVADLLDENAQLLAELERRDVERVSILTWWCRGFLAGYRAGRVRRRQAP